MHEVNESLTKWKTMDNFMRIDLKKEIDRVTPEMVEIRRDLHRHPELSFEENRTAGLVAERLRSLGLEVQTGVGRTGVVGLLRGAKPGTTVALRADMDALPVQEEGSREYRSQTEGVSHACGHDGHTAVLLASADILAKHARELRGNVKFIFQPGEEVAAGAMGMIEQGVMVRPKVDAILSIHLWNYIPVGKVGFRPGPIFASVDDINITIKGRGGHGALPHQTIDPIPIAAQVVTALQHIVSRSLSPFEPAVITIGKIHGGTAWNIIPDEVSMAGTIRAYDMSVRDFLLERIEDTIRGICLASNAEYELNIRFASPPVVNDASVTEAIRHVAEQSLGTDQVVTAEMTTTGDDVAYFNEAAPGCYFMVGSGNPKRGLDKPHHHRQFDFDEAALPIAVEVLTSGTLKLLQH